MFELPTQSYRIVESSVSNFSGAENDGCRAR